MPYSIFRPMFIGDSITAGFSDYAAGGYRTPLLALLATRLGTAALPVGWDSNASNALGPRQMCGVSGERIDEIGSRLVLQAPGFNPDCFLFHAGTNDTTQLQSGGSPTVATSMVNLTAALDTMRATGSTRKIFVAKIVDHQTYPAAIVTFNNALVSNVQARADFSAGNTILVDMYAALGLWSSTYFFDATHPNAAGYGLMATTWYNALVNAGVI